MDLIPSFSVDHTRIVPGIFTSRTDTLGDQTVTTYDVRVTVPNTEPAVDPAAMHSLEHLIATFLRNDPDWKDQIIYWGPMGCLTGFYLILKGNREPKEIYSLIHNLGIAKWHARKYAGYLAQNAGNPAIFEYPKAERPVTEDGSRFFDS